MSGAWFATFVAMLLLLPGLSLVVVGWRGRRIDDHPLCRRCGFDLSGATGGAACPECGADLTRPRALRYGNRKKRRGAQIAGALSLALAAATFGAAGYATHRGAQPASLKPTWWLMIEMRLGGGTGAAAADELSQRSLTPRQLAQLRDRILEVQADKATPWFTQWGDAFERLRATGNVSDEQWRRYAEQAVVVQVIVRPRVRQASKLPMRLRAAGRGGSASSLWLTVEPKTLSFNGEEISVAVDPSIKPYMEGQGNQIDPLQTPFGLLQDRVVQLPAFSRRLNETEERTLTLRLTARATVHDGTPFGVAPPLIEREVSTETTATLVSPSTPTVTPIRDKARERPVRESVDVVDCRVWGGLLLQATIVVSDPPVSLSFQPYLRADGKEWPVGRSITVPAGGGWSEGFSWDLPAPIADRVDIILRPNESAAEADLNLVDYWASDIVIPDLPVTHAQTRAAPQR